MRTEVTLAARLDEPRLAALRQIAQRYGVRDLRVFGSRARGEARPDSDLDLLVDPMPGATLFDLGELQQELEALLGVPVDLLTPGDLPPGFRARVLAEATPV